MPDESHDLTASFQGRRVAAKPAVRTEIELGSWKLSLLGVPEAELDAVVMRIEARSASQRLKGCSECEVVVEGTAFRHHTSYHADVTGGRIGETFMVRMPVAELRAMTTSLWSSVGVCGNHQLLGGAARAQVRSFLQQLAAGRASDPMRSPERQVDGAPIAIRPSARSASATKHHVDDGSCGNSDCRQQPTHRLEVGDFRNGRGTRVGERDHRSAMR